MHEEHPRRRTLESLRKEAKRWLRALREDDATAHARLARALRSVPASPTLRDVQHALAVEHGASGWAELSRYLEEAQARSTATLEQYEQMASALLDAYNTGTPEAMQRHWALTWHRRAWPAMRTYVQLDLGRVPRDDVEITVDDARQLVAAEHGHESWEALRAYVSAMPVRGPVLMKPVSIMADDATEDSPPIASAREWHRLLQHLDNTSAKGLAAHGQMTDALLADLARFPHLTSLHLGGSHAVTDEGVRHLAALPLLRHVDLSGTSITDRGLAALRDLAHLETISLAGTRVTDAGVAALAGCNALEDVNLAGTMTGNGALEALKGKPRLAQFSSGNAITDDGLRVLHEFPVFKTWQGGTPDYALTSYEAKPNRLFLRGGITDRGFANLRGLDGLFGLNVDDSKLALTAAALEPLLELPHLGWLAFDAKDESMPLIARLPHLRFLLCQDTPASDDGFAALSRSQSLEYLWGRRCHNLQRRGFLALSTMPSLRGLSVSCLNVDDIGIAALPDFPALRELMPMDIPDEGYRHIGKCADLESLVLMYCRDTTDRATEHITALGKLSRYFASYTRITDRTPELLSHIASLESVTLDGCPGLTNQGVAALARLPRLRELRISGQHITSDVMSSFPPHVRTHYFT